MTPPARPDPVAALAAMYERWKSLADGQLSDSMQRSYIEADVGTLILDAVEAGYVLVSADMLRAALLQTELSFKRGDDASARAQAAAILAALKGPAR